MTKTKSIFAAGLIAVAAQASLASTIPGTATLQQRFLMQDSTTGQLQPPSYSLRLDGIFGGGNRVTFSSQANGARAYIDIFDDGGNTLIHLHGTLFGGVDVGSDWADPGSADPQEAQQGTYTGLYELDFLYEVNVETRPNGWVVQGQMNTANDGTLTPLTPSDDTPRPLQDFFNLVDNDNNTFLFLNDGTDRHFGTGWLTTNPNGQNENRTRDFKFEGIPVIPVPTSALLATAGLGVIASRRRR